jgi:hypothetical protein
VVLSSLTRTDLSVVFPCSLAEGYGAALVFLTHQMHQIAPVMHACMHMHDHWHIHANAGSISGSKGVQSAIKLPRPFRLIPLTSFFLNPNFGIPQRVNLGTEADTYLLRNMLKRVLYGKWDVAS